MTSAKQETMTACNQTESADDCVDEVRAGVLFVTFNGFLVTLPYLLFNVLLVMVGASAILLNAIVLHVIVRLKPKEPGEVVLLSLALTDGVTGLLVLYICVYNVLNFQSPSECLFRHGFLQFCCCSSTYHLVLLTLDRYVRIARPLHYGGWWRTTKVAVASAAVWVACAIYGCLPLAGWNNLDLSTSFSCSFLGILHPHYFRLMLVLFCVPFGVVVVLYVHIFLIARRHVSRIAAQDVAASATMTTTAGFEKQSWRFTKTVSIIIGGYVICWTPIGLVLILYLSGFLEETPSKNRRHAVFYTSLSVFLNSIVNPVIYAFKIPAVRMRFRLIRQRLCCGSLRTRTGGRLSVD